MEQEAESKSRKSRKWILAVVIGSCVLVAIVVVVLTTNKNVGKNKQTAVDLVKEYLDEPGSMYDSGMFETWEATGNSNMMEVCATYYPQNEEDDGEHHSEDVLHEMRWQVNLKTGKVIYLETVDPDG